MSRFRVLDLSEKQKYLAAQWARETKHKGLCTCKKNGGFWSVCNIHMPKELQDLSTYSYGYRIEDFHIRKLSYWHEMSKL